jgi:hypothetical protein
MRMSPEATLEPDPWDNLETLAEVCAFTARKFGEEGLRQALAIVEGPSRRENFEDAAYELKAIGLTKAAAVVAEFAAACPSRADMVFCPYLVPPYRESPGNERNIECWQRSEQYRAEEQRRKRASVNNRSSHSGRS